ncbi:hypothetical protein BU14_0072s0007 [Porphyra umbilicalis]|uniref:Protein kinase domain-containing protein n=1 Tax=Porphyra umbilicalis TaxID=2786 RepID=A0A1X6PFM2_PORUM|nr:hypothetical protein BU14_0072s0007 [Porphyra umbilicalis]|eukprot:OSX79649.1 hypothetical protein BU14_0072s0007 [Porphyra umbilicalis]
MAKYVRREIRCLGRLRHAGIPRLKEVLTTADHVLIVMELARGAELLDALAVGGALPRRAPAATPGSSSRPSITRTGGASRTGTSSRRMCWWMRGGGGSS